MTAAGTTDPAVPPGARPRRSGVSVRTRLTATVALLVALALTGVGLIIYALESARVENAAHAEAEQEIAEFRTLQRDGLDPNTARPFASIARLLEVFLQRNVPSDNELIVAWVDGDDKFQSTSRHASLTSDPTFRESVRAMLDEGGTLHADSEFGEILVTVQTVKGDVSRGALVVVNFLEDAREELDALMRTYVITALLSFVVITGLAAWQAGRLLAPLGQLSRTTEEITATDLSRRLPETGNDDITALTRTANRMLTRLEAAFVGQRQFLDDAGHELKTPLTVLSGHLELLDPDNPAEVAETRELLLDEVDRMSRLVQDLILLAKSQRPDFLSPQPVSLERLTHTVLAKARGLGGRDWVLDEAGEAIVSLDEQRITQALLQLADNGVKHTTGGDQIAFGSSVTDREVRVWVRDTGPGVPVDDRDHIFERFGRSVVAANDDGFGLGLSIVRAICEAHGGTVTVEDAVPSGARFVITLPRTRSEDPVAHILIVEDEQRIASFVAKGLKAEGHQTTVEADGRTGLDLAMSGAYDLVVLDIGLPTMDGFEVLDTLRSQGSRVPVIVLTARDSVADTVSALEGGADDYMPKPFRFAELLARVRLRLRQANEQPTSREDALEAGGVRLDLRTRRATVDGKEVDLSAREFALAEIFMLNPGQVLSREQLLDHVWGYDFDPGSNVVDVYVGYLRKKFGARTVVTVRGMGYRFSP